ncbi:cytochrome P450 2A6 [Caerostris extrusa]|uniref:Cytochrome P450 2A6 n=1 Tax=Caerostris extrusa TaxID=172846 RepID=A0AAV4XB76_CAEEX|nr:cytochrome P450 2A6 [Caerostris extrusa]
MIGVCLGTKYTVILNEYNVAKEVLSHPAALDRSPNIFGHLKPGAVTGLLTANGEEWVEQRKFCFSASRDLGLGRSYWEDLIMQESSDFVKKLQELNGKPVETYDDISSSVISNIVSLLIGRQLDKEKEADKIRLCVDYSDVALIFTSPSSPCNVVPGLRKLLEVLKIAGYDKAAKIVDDFTDFLRAEIGRHKISSESKQERDFINSYLERLAELKASKNTKHYFSEPMLEGNLNALFIGATDTISVFWVCCFALCVNTRTSKRRSIMKS